MTERADKTIELRVLRYNPETDERPHHQSFTVPYTSDMSVLQGLQWIKDTVDGSLTYRWSCRMAICGSCGMMINAEPKLACHTLLRDLAPGPVTVEPLNHFPIERDLVVTVDDFVKKIESVTPWLIPKHPKPVSEGPYNQTPAQLAAYENFSACINCMLCYAACPQYGENPKFIGPAAMAILQRYDGDSRDGGSALRIDAVHGEDGVWGCTAVGACSDVCPKAVDPMHAVNQNKMNTALDYFLRFLKKRDAK
ncbi:succinate dehydrogenase and fumarate reductase iron-sulfur protein [Rhodomicrobium vannielii ATCC 17100]|uniref:succinate dehydrogenase n=1 Tax=Rhodomicrobium vannielii (strain ATCC 17100 / DSM 162 / LMG 4299 / NCIMB 10020 / ATH 3.1.1) TaxID=648757 RepID=E3HZV1_RHOVT|nr:succinate dehydrogenase/fumarate reductase iron-sulfur subunit [Rhodomicrobium vannielii]ADP72211.1 succinate dehydrogenase and fumarate reductase iron-sulfur protein [Rhodomicrobium vannielii ATCC 17100]